MAPLAITPLPRERQRVAPWRNGGGTTREIAIDPPGADAARAFRRRISVARVGQDGAFSRFPGVDRSLWLLSGSGVELDVAGDRVRIDRVLQRFDFAGEVAIAARLLDGPIEDLNVMADRSAVAAQAEIVRCAGVGAWRAALRPGSQVVLVVDGSLRIGDAALGDGDAVRAEGEGELAATAGTRGAVFLCASFSDVRR
jgi:hypothetical protein